MAFCNQKWKLVFKAPSALKAKILVAVQNWGMFMMVTWCSGKVNLNVIQNCFCKFNFL